MLKSVETEKEASHSEFGFKYKAGVQNGPINLEDGLPKQVFDPVYADDSAVLAVPAHQKMKTTPAQENCLELNFD